MFPQIAELGSAVPDSLRSLQATCSRRLAPGDLPHCNLELLHGSAVGAAGLVRVALTASPSCTESPMDNQNQNSQFDCDLPPEHEFENAADSSGLWFAAAVLFAVIAAGII